MSDEPPFEPFRSGQRSLGGWLRGEPSPRASVILGVVLALLAVLPVLVARYPQMVDYAAHLARYHIMLNRAESPFLREYYGFQWHLMGNLGADIAIWPFAKLFGLETAGRIIVALVVLFTGLGVVAVEWVLRHRIGLGSLLALCFVWSPPMLLGFLNFGFALAGALFGFAFWVKLERWKWRWALFLPYGFLVWLAHVSGWGVLGVMVFGYEWHKEKSWRTFLKPWPLMLPFIALLFAGEGTRELASYGKNVLTYKWAIFRQALRDVDKGLDYATSGGIALLLVAALALKRFDWRLGWAALAMFGLAIVMPRHIFAGDLVDARMVTTGMIVGCLALSWRAPRWVLLLAAMLFLGRLGLTTRFWYDQSQQTARVMSLVDRLPQGARVASMVITERSSWRYNPQEHVGAFTVVRKDALNNSNFALPKVHMITIKQGGPHYRDPFHRLLRYPGKPVDMSRYGPAFEADWFLYVGQAEPKLPAGASVVERVEGAFLAKLANPPRHR